MRNNDSRAIQIQTSLNTGMGCRFTSYFCVTDVPGVSIGLVSIAFSCT